MSADVVQESNLPHRDSQIRSYSRFQSVVFRKTNEAFGGFSNMAGGYPLLVNDIRILTSEALYQSCRFPDRPDIQRMIIGQNSPMTAKMVTKPYQNICRSDWAQVRVKIMRWCLRVKLAQNFKQFSELLLSTGNNPIVEESRRDNFWGANPVNGDTLVGMNVLGRLLMEVRDEIASNNFAPPPQIEPLEIPNFLLDGYPIRPITIKTEKIEGGNDQVPDSKNESSEANGEPKQLSFFDS